MIEVRGLTKRYGGRAVVDGLTFEVRPGRVTGFLGPNGAGKSTALRMVLGLDRPSAGTATVGGRPYAAHPAPLREVGALLDAKALQGGRRAADHLLWLARSNGIPARRVAETLELTGLAGAARRRAGTLSLRMTQRLGLAAALLGDPAVLILDEPLNGLDTEGIRWLRGLLRTMAGQGRTVLLSSHVMSEMELVADHLVVIGRGRLLSDSPLAEFVARRTRPETRVAAPDPGRLAGLLRAAGAAVRESDGALIASGLTAPEVGALACAHGLPLHELTPRRSSLEDVCTTLTAPEEEFTATTSP